MSQAFIEAYCGAGCAAVGRPHGYVFRQCARRVLLCLAEVRASAPNRDPHTNTPQGRDPVHRVPLQYEVSPLGLDYRTPQQEVHDEILIGTSAA